MGRMPIRLLNAIARVDMTKVEVFVDYCLSLKYTYEQVVAAAGVLGIKAPTPEKWFYYMNFVSLSILEID